LERLTIFEVSESELDTLEKGSPDSIYFNISIFLISSALSLITALLTSTPKWPIIQTIFLIIIIVGLIMGGILLILWIRSRCSISKCVKTIRNRLPPEGEPQNL
jgi:hypothetical protein